VLTLSTVVFLYFDGIANCDLSRYIVLTLPNVVFQDCANPFPTVIFLDSADTAHCGLSVLLVARSRIRPLAYSKGKDDRQ
jgi:hypothetical protein